MTDHPRSLARFAVSLRDDGGFLLVLEDEAGVVTRFIADEEQLDLLADLVDDALGAAAPD